MSTFTYTNAYTRAEAVVDQVSVLFTKAGIDAGHTTKVCHGVANRWLEAVGVYLMRDNYRVYEISARICWAGDSDNAQLEFSTDLPGWDEKASPEIAVLGRRFAAIANPGQ
jgi:hypothetical protein